MKTADQRAYDVFVEKFKREGLNIDALIDIYSIFSKRPRLRNFEKPLLNYYIRFGISRATRDKFIADTGRKRNQIVQTAYYLRKKGYIIKQFKGKDGDKLPQDLVVGTKPFCDIFEKIVDYKCLVNPYSKQNQEEGTAIELLETPILNKLKEWDIAGKRLTFENLAIYIGSNKEYVRKAVNKHDYLKLLYYALKEQQRKFNS